MKGSKPKAVYIDHPGKVTPTWEVLPMGGHSLAIHMNKGDKYKVDCSCDLVFTERIMDEVGQAIRDEHNKLEVSQEIPMFYSWTTRGVMKQTRPSRHVFPP